MKIQTREFNAQTGETIDSEREATADEIAEMQKEEALKQQREAIAAEKTAARQAVLDKLGLTAEEIAALLS
jgi:hypothetical protein